MASDWGQNRDLDFVASSSPTHVEISSSGHRFRFFVASLSWLGCDATRVFHYLMWSLQTMLLCFVFQFTC